MASEEEPWHFDNFARQDLVSWVFQNERYDQEKKLYIDPEDPARSISASEARTLVRKLVAGFKANGLQPGDCVCIHAFNDVMYTPILLGIIGAGGCYTGSNPAYTPPELAHHLQNTKARFLITNPELLSNISAAAEVVGVTSSRTFLLDPSGHGAPNNYNLVEHLLDNGEEDWVIFSEENQARNTTAALLSTSGTTGLPKAAMLSHYNFIVQNLQLHDAGKKPYQASRLITVPMFHAYAFPIAHLSALREGIPTYIMSRFEIHKYLSNIEKYQITETAMVPAIMHTIVKQWAACRPKFFSSPLNSLRLVWCAGSPLDERTQDNMYRLLEPCVRVVQVWGMTEALWISTFLWPEKDHSASVGRLLPGIEAKFVAEDGTLVPRPTHLNPAEISVRGPNIMQGYLGNHEATNATIDNDGWLVTGDLAYEEHGKFYIVDRKKEMIKVRGWQVSPAELEAALRDHLEILDAAVIGVLTPISVVGEAPRAYIVRTPDSQLSETEIRTYMSKCLANYKQLNGGIVFVDAIPRTSTGKVDRKALKELAKKEMVEFKEISLTTAVGSAVGSAFRTVSRPTSSSAAEAGAAPPSTLSLIGKPRSSLVLLPSTVQSSAKVPTVAQISPVTSESSVGASLQASPIAARSSVDSDPDDDVRLGSIDTKAPGDIARRWLVQWSIRSITRLDDSPTTRPMTPAPTVPLRPSLEPRPRNGIWNMLLGRRKSVP